MLPEKFEVTEPGKDEKLPTMVQKVHKSQNKEKGKIT